MQHIIEDKTVLFTNWTDEDMTETWDKKPFTVKKGESKYLPLYLAIHLGKHLVDRELNKQGLPTNHFSRIDLEKKCIQIDDKKDLNSVEAEIDLLNQSQKQNEIDPEENLKKTAKPKKAQVVPEEEFEGLK
jgi:hypothetical protein